MGHGGRLPRRGRSLAGPLGGRPSGASGDAATVTPTRLAAIDETCSRPDQRIDRLILLDEIDKVVFGDEVLRDEAWDPLSLVYLMGSGLFGLLSREYAPWPERGASLLARLRGLPGWHGPGAGRPHGPARSAGRDSSSSRRRWRSSPA